MSTKRLGVGFIGSGFISRFHIQSFIGVRDADVLGVWSPNQSNAAATAEYATSLRVGNAAPYSSITTMIEDPAIDVLWMCGPNHQRIANMEEIVETLQSGKGSLVGVTCEKPLARNVAEARRMVELLKEADILDGYLEDQVFTPAVVRGRELLWKRAAAASGRPYLARSAEEHSGPHASWFWQGELQGGGVLNDMICHSVEAARFLLTDPTKPRTSLTPRRVSAQMACLKWQRAEYSKKLRDTYGADIDYENKPSEDFAHALVEFVDEEGTPVIVETTTSWCFVGAGLRLSVELQGPEYSMSWNSLDEGLKVFLSRDLKQAKGEDLVEKQNAESGLMPVVSNEAATYGYESQNRHMVESFLDGTRPSENFDDGLAVTELLMTAYMSAEKGRTIDFPPPDLDSFVPQVAQGTWNPKRS